MKPENFRTREEWLEYIISELLDGTWKWWDIKDRTALDDISCNEILKEYRRIVRKYNPKVPDNAFVFLESTEC